MGKHIVYVLISLSLLIFVCIAELQPALVEGPTKAPVGCHRRMYTYQVTQTDSKGYTCSEKIEVNGCWGRCDSKEISDYKFPYKKSYHPVCVPKGISKVVIMLENCDPEAGIEARRYEYIEPLACACQICSSINTSCESPQALHKNSVQRLGGQQTKVVPPLNFEELIYQDVENNELIE